MPRKPLILSNDLPYHITNRSNNREFFYIRKESLWNIFRECLTELKIQYNCRIHAFVLMGNHYHLLVTTPEANIGEAMKYLHREVARKANRDANRINHFFGGRYKWSLIATDHYYLNTVKYIFRNPIRAGICTSVKNYPFSSLNDRNSLWEMDDLDVEWLNKSFPEKSEQMIGRALRRREFKIPRCPQTGYVLDLDDTQYRKGTVT